jgi:hypothetical protein
MILNQEVLSLFAKIQIFFSDNHLQWSMDDWSEIRIKLTNQYLDGGF